jgi:hypothetical protein
MPDRTPDLTRLRAISAARKSSHVAITALERLLLALQLSRSPRDHRQYPGRVGEDIVVPEPQNLEIMRGQHIGAHAVAPLPALGSMLSAVQLDDQAEFDTGEVSKVGGHRLLAPKPQAAQPATTQVVSEPVLGISLPLAQTASEIALIVG